MSTYHLDYETYSAADLKTVGQYRYAADPSTQALMVAVAKDNQEPLLVTHPDYESPCPEALELLCSASGSAIYAHNAPFEMAITKHRMDPDFGLHPSLFPLHNWRCTAVMARRAGLPARLGQVAETLGLADQKDKDGTRLIKKFSVPDKKGNRTYPDDAPEDWEKFRQYCIQDVRTERAVHQALQAFDLVDLQLVGFQLDSVINDRGLQVDVVALRSALKIVQSEAQQANDRFRALTGLNVTQRDKVFQWLVARGYPQRTLQAVDMTRALHSAPAWADAEAQEALELRQYTSFAATTKIATMLKCAEEDGRVRGALKFYGAGTGRWSGQLIQPQNFKRPTLKPYETDLAYDLIKNEPKAREVIKGIWHNPLEVVSSTIRHFIKGPFFDADYSSIEARIVCWLAGQDDAVARFAAGVDSYVTMASVVFNKPEPNVTGDERWLGKQTILGCGFGMGPDKFYDQCLELSEKFGIEGINVTKELAIKAIAAYRSSHSAVVNLWRSCDSAARRAILHPGVGYAAGSKLRFVVRKLGPVTYLLMRLPSGRCLAYPHPKVEERMKTFRNKDGTKERKSVQAITFFGQIPMKTKWGRVDTYGGKLVENATQATAADIMINGVKNAEDRGFQVATLVHDQALAYYDQSLTPEDFSKALTDIPEWAHGIPVEAEASVQPYYTKT